ncbi:hypothetical protein ACHQM5_008901 [Ranunculus cassubicifolius]
MKNSFLQIVRSSKSWLPNRTFIKSPITRIPINLNGCCSSSSSSLQFSINPSSIFFRHFSAKFSNESDSSDEELGYNNEESEYRIIDDSDKTFDEQSSEEWEEEEETVPEIGDGGDGGGIVFGEKSWGQRALDLANEVLQEFGDDFKIFSFKNTPRGYIYVRLDKLSEKYGCPSMEEIEHFSCIYNKFLEEAGKLAEIPEDVALEVSSPGAERLLRVPEDLGRFKDMPMRVCYVEGDLKSQPKERVFFLDSIETASEQSVWRLADVKENRDPLAKGRPMSRKQKDWRLILPFESLKRVTLFLDC